MFTVWVVIVAVIPSVWSAHSWRMEDILCNLCGKPYTQSVDLTALKEAVRANRRDIEKKNKDIKDLKKGSTDVAFFAYLSTNWKQLSKYKTLVYDVVDLNDGNGYDKTTGKFTAPSTGTYVFYVSTGAMDRSHATVELVLNYSIKNIAWADSHDHDDRTYVTSVTPLKLKKGDVIITRIGFGGGRYIESNTKTRTSFSGIKIN